MADKQKQPPPFVNTQPWGDVRPRATELKKEILRDVQKIVVVGNVTGAPIGSTPAPDTKPL